MKEANNPFATSRSIVLAIIGAAFACTAVVAAYHTGPLQHTLLCALYAAFAVSLWQTAASIRLREAIASTATAALVIALFAASADSAANLWQIPQNPHALMVLTDFGAALSCAIYLLAVFANVVRKRCAPSLPASIGLLALPYLFNFVLSLASPPFMADIGHRLLRVAAITMLPDAQVGRALILIAFNEILLLGIGWVMDRRWARAPRLHAVIVAGSVLAAFTPLIADAGSSAALGGWPLLPRIAALAATAALAQAGLWAQTFFATGILLDALHRRRPTTVSCTTNWRAGFVRGAIYGALFILLIHVVAQVIAVPVIVAALQTHPVLGAAILGAPLFPLLRNIIESFDGSVPFFRRLRAAYADPVNYLRGITAGAGLGIALHADLPQLGEGVRFLSGFGIGALAFAGVDLIRDACDIGRGRRQRLQTWRIYLLGALLGGVVGGALAWYFDAMQMQVVIDKFFRYATVNFAATGGKPIDFTVYPLFSKWGAISLGSVDGGVSLFYSESLAGVINWSIAAPLFGVNLVVLTAAFERSFAPIRELFSGAGFVNLIEQTVRVLRWGPWMAPIISSFLRVAPAPTWYNQDGLVRTFVAIWQSGTLPPDAFRAWGLECFLGLLAYDWLRVLIWFDHMGLRVATLVNLSFVGVDALDERAARFAGHSGRTRFIPEGIRRFLTWAPLLIPFYIPRGGDWDHAWNGAEALAKTPQAPLLPDVATLLVGYAIAATLLISAGAAIVWIRRRHHLHVAPRNVTPSAFVIGNGQYTVELNADGRGFSHVTSQVRPDLEVDLTRRPDDPLQLRGKFFYLREIDDNGEVHGLPWSLGAQPAHLTGEDYRVKQIDPTTLRIINTRGGLRVEALVSVAQDEPLERWTLRLTNLKQRTRSIELTSYQEPAVGPVDAYRRTPAFAAMHVGTVFVRSLNALFAHNRLMKGGNGPISREVGFHAVGTTGAFVQILGYEDSRSHFIGTGTLRAPAVFVNAPIRTCDDEGMLYSFDPAASLRLRVDIAAGATVEVPFLDGYAPDHFEAARLISRHLGTSMPSVDALGLVMLKVREIHVPPEPRDAGGFSDDGRELRVPADAQRPWTHVLANPLGQGAVIGGDGDVFSFAGNAQQNCLTPYNLDSIPTQAPGQAIFVLDTNNGDIDTASFTPYRRRDAEHDCVFGLGYAQFRNRRGDLELDQTIFIPPDQPIELRLLRIRNRGTITKRLRVVPYFEIVLAETPVDSLGRIEVIEDGGVLLFSNPRNDFRKGWAFVATSIEDAAMETLRARFIGARNDLTHPHFAMHARGDGAQSDDGRRCAAFAGDFEVAAGREVSMAVVLGHSASRETAIELAQRYRDVASTVQALTATKRWWSEQLSILRIATDRPDFDRLVNDWLPYQVLTARLWGRCGPQQRSGAFGFRDQLQDVLPLTFTQPQRARDQILLHAAQQFREGDVVKWWHLSWEGKIGIAVRTAASDPQLWLPYVVCRYVQATGDDAILKECVPFLEGQVLPPGQEGIMFVPNPSRDTGTLYEHCRRAIEWTLARKGAHGIPLLGSGDWNDGIDAAGINGRGESAWMGFFLHTILRDFAPLAEQMEGEHASGRYRAEEEELREALDAMWRDDAAGAGYLHAITDDGDELRFASGLVTAWPALSGAVDLDRAIAALEGGLARLEKDNRVLLLAPPFKESSKPYPGRIAEYPPGVRENGGQYSHGASWLVDAWLRCAELATARGDTALAAHCRVRAWEIWLKVSPLTKTAPSYGLPPHQQPADVYDGAGHNGRGGWAWYTGAAARMLSAAYALVGVHMDDGELHVEAADPALPRLRHVDWRGRRINPS